MVHICSVIWVTCTDTLVLTRTSLSSRLELYKYLFYLSYHNMIKAACFIRQNSTLDYLDDILWCTVLSLINTPDAEMKLGARLLCALKCYSMRHCWELTARASPHPLSWRHSCALAAGVTGVLTQVDTLCSHGPLYRPRRHRYHHIHLGMILFGHDDI